MGKRKREPVDVGAPQTTAPKATRAQPTSILKQARQPTPPPSKRKAANGQAAVDTAVNGKRDAVAKDDGRPEDTTTTVQVITGSYERALHGFTASIPSTLLRNTHASLGEQQPDVTFSDTFLFNAHASAVRCLALSPLSDDSSKVTLATGSTDERINLYSLSTVPPKLAKGPRLPSLRGSSITENTKNKELGSLLHHSSSTTALYFPTRSKLLSSAEDSTIAITRTRDWTPLSTIKAPIPKPQGRPSGDTAAPGEVPSGINDFAVHPSMKLMVSVGKGEKCMRLWNLVTGKKAGVLNFSREILNQAGEGRFGTGEGRSVRWNAEGEEFVVAFERGAIVFGIDCKPKAKVVPTPRTKLHQMHYVPGPDYATLLAVSTEDGRVMFYDTNNIPLSGESPVQDGKNEEVPNCKLVAQLGGPAVGISGRVKDFEMLNSGSRDSKAIGEFIVVTGSSDGSVRIWILKAAELRGGDKKEQTTDTDNSQTKFTAKQIGNLIGTYSTGTRITCLKAFIMTGTPDAADEQVEEEKSEESSSSDEESERTS